MAAESIRKFLRPFTCGDRDFTKAEKEILNFLCDRDDYILPGKIECRSVKESGKVKILKRLTKAGFIENKNLNEGHPGRKALGYRLREHTRMRLKMKPKVSKGAMRRFAEAREKNKNLDKEIEEMLEEIPDTDVHWSIS